MDLSKLQNRGVALFVGVKMKRDRRARLHDAFDKYLPAVMEGQTVKKAKTVSKPALTESTEVTGDRKVKPEVGLDNIIDIRKLAGLK